MATAAMFFHIQVINTKFRVQSFEISPYSFRKSDEKSDYNVKQSETTPCPQRSKYVLILPNAG